MVQEYNNNGNDWWESLMDSFYNPLLVALLSEYIFVYLCCIFFVLNSSVIFLSFVHKFLEECMNTTDYTGNACVDSKTSCTPTTLSISPFFSPACVPTILLSPVVQPTNTAIHRMFNKCKTIWQPKTELKACGNRLYTQEMSIAITASSQRCQYQLNMFSNKLCPKNLVIAMVPYLQRCQEPTFYDHSNDLKLAKKFNTSKQLFLVLKMEGKKDTNFTVQIEKTKGPNFTVQKYRKCMII